MYLWVHTVFYNPPIYYYYYYYADPEMSTRRARLRTYLSNVFSANPFERMKNRKKARIESAAARWLNGSIAARVLYLLPLRLLRRRLLLSFSIRHHSIRENSTPIPRPETSAVSSPPTHTQQRDALFSL